MVLPNQFACDSKNVTGQNIAFFSEMNSLTGLKLYWNFIHIIS